MDFGRDVVQSVLVDRRVCDPLLALAPISFCVDLWQAASCGLVAAVLALESLILAPFRR